MMMIWRRIVPLLQDGAVFCWILQFGQFGDVSAQMLSRFMFFIGSKSTWSAVKNCEEFARLRICRGQDEQWISEIFTAAGQLVVCRSVAPPDSFQLGHMHVLGAARSAAESAAKLGSCRTRTHTHTHTHTHTLTFPRERRARSHPLRIASDYPYCAKLTKEKGIESVGQLTAQQVYWFSGLKVSRRILLTRSNACSMTSGRKVLMSNCETTAIK